MKTAWMVLAVTMLSAIAGASRASAQRATPIADPCKLLTQAEASAAIGATLAPGETRRFGIITRCSFFNRANREQQVLLDVHNETAPSADSVLFDSYSHLPDAKPVSGVGDKALWIGNGLVILKGGRMVEMKLPRTLATMTPAVENAAKLIASRM